MIKFIKNNSRKLYIIGSAILVLMIAVLGVMIAGEFGKNVSAANTHTVTVEKTSTVTVYVSGKGVTYDPSLSTDNTEVYHVEENTSITLRAVNESRVFTSWQITGGYNKVDNAAVLTDKLFEITPTADITIDTEKKNALLADYGEYMNASFMITLDTHLMYLQKIFEAGPVLANVANKDVLDAYDYFFEKYSTYENNILPISNTAQKEAKATAIINNGLFTKIQNGYYKIGSSFSLLDENFKGIGNETYPFKGIFCGNSNSTKATIFVTASGTETSGDMLRGLFQITDPEAVIRNVNIRVSLGVKANSSTAATNIYAGGVAGKVNKSVISNVDVLARIAVDATSANIYAGGVAGELAGGLDDSRNILINGNDSTFILTTYASEKSIYSGLVSGNATNVYVKEANIDTTSFAISAKNTASNTYNANTNVYLGNLFGKYTATSAMPIENVKIFGSEKESITSLISSGNSYIGGLIGHLTVKSGSVNLGDVSIKNTSGESKLSASSVDKNSQTNLLTAGLIACVEGAGLNPTEEFLDGAKEKIVDGVKHYEYEYIFNTDLLIQSVNNGLADGIDFGKTMASGFIARGYMNLNGTDSNRNEIFLSSADYTTKVYATQTSTSSHLYPETGANDKEHCVATAFYGNINKTSGTIQYINIYASNFDIAATRELGSKGNGDVMAAGFLSYAQGVTISDCTLYLDESSIKGHSLSYEVTNSTANANNTYVGGFIGQFEGLNYYTPLTLKNIKFAGNYDHKTNVVSGSSTIIEGIQNSVGGGDDQNCNFIGGIVGWLQHANANGLYFEGSNSDRDYIASLTHENPASAFCGGVIGYIRTRDGRVITIENIEISKTKVYSGATVINAKDIPDIYVGGILGSAFCQGSTVGVNINSTRVIDVDIIGEGNENIQLTVGGIVGSTTWDGKVTINNSYVIRSNISSSLAFNLTYRSTNLCSHAAGIIGRSNTNADINNCAVIDSVINSEFKNNSGYSIYCDTSSSLIYGNSENALTGAGGAETVNISNCYSNSSVKSTSNMYTIVRNYSDSAGKVSVSNSYYVKQNVESATGLGTALDFSSVPVGYYSNTLLFDGDLVQNTAYKYYIDIDDTSLFTIGNTGTSLGAYATVQNSSSFADIWINAKASGDTSKNPSNYATETELIEAGWFKLGSLVIYNGTPETSATKGTTDYSYIMDNAEYVYQTTGENAGKYLNINYPYNVIDSVNYNVVVDRINNVILNNNNGNKNVTLESIINVDVVSNMHQLKMTFNINPSNYYPVLFDSAGKLIQTSGLVYDEFGTFDFIVDDDKTYTIKYSPNESINHDVEFYMGFVDGKGNLLTTSCHKFVINHNEKIFVGLIYADYTKPINYQDITYIDSDLDDVMDVIYKLRSGTVIKILPVFVMSNEPDKYIISELDVSTVKYSSNVGTMKSNGEFIAPSSGDGEITATYTEDGNTTTKKINLSIVEEITVTYSAIGADIQALTYATPDNDYYLDLDLLEHYGGDPSLFNISMISAGTGFISPAVNLGTNQYISKLIITLGGRVSDVFVYGSTDGGNNFDTKELVTFGVYENYADYTLNLSDNSYNSFNIVTSSSEGVGILGYTVVISESKTVTYSNKASDTYTATLSGDVYVTREVNLVTGGYVEFPESKNGYFTGVELRIGNGTGRVYLEVKTEGSSEWEEYTYQSHNNQNYFTNYTINIARDKVIAIRLYVDSASATFRLSNLNYRLSYSSSYKSWDFSLDDAKLTTCTYTNYIVCIKKTVSYNTAAAVFSLSGNNEFSTLNIKFGNVSGINNTNKARGADIFISTSSDKNTGGSTQSTYDHPKIWSAYDQYTSYTTRELDFVYGSENNRYDSKQKYSHLIVRIPSDGPNELRIESVSDVGKLIFNNVVTSEFNYNFKTVDEENKEATLNKYDYTSVSTETVDIENASKITVSNILGITIKNSNVLDKNAILNKNWVYTNNGITPVTSWDIETTNYSLIIPKEYLKDNKVSSFVVNAEFPVVYTISFDLQSDSFNPDYTGKTEFSYKVEAGTTFTELFGTPTTPTENYNELLDALKPELHGGVKKFGFVFGGFYLIDSGNSLDAYSMSFEELLEKQGGLEIYSSYNFFGRWSFLIEHIEAPGTEIKTSFEPGFMENIGLTEEEREELELNDSITIPINNNRGYVFTVEKEEGFIGEAQVNAYIVANENHIDKNDDGKCDICNNPAEEIKSDHIREITIEKYHDNMYLYFIPAEEITGYLVIVSNVTNSSIIVGKNTASVTEQILPEDGIYTFKYVVNHKDGESYIYDSTANLLNIKRNIMIEFFTQVYDEDDKATDVEERKLPIDTVIEVYYSLYEDGVLTDQTIGVYKTTSADESKVYLDQFKKWNQAEDAFSDITFATLLSNNTTTSEVYYFVVTPPNGTDTRRSTSGNEIINEVIYVGYCNEAKTDYISGMRNDDDIINQPIEDIVEGVATKESSKNEKIYSVTPSRVTNLTKADNNNYTFTDITTYHVIDLDISNGSINDGKIVLSDDATNNTIITSSDIKGKIRELGLELGFGTGLVEVLGSTDGLSWTPITTFLVDDVDYKYYYVDFEAKGNNFTHFKVDNKSLGEMRLASFNYNTISNAMEYKYSISEGELDENTLSFVNKIKGDTRHDGKTFMLAVEYSVYKTDEDSISLDTSILVNGKEYKPLLAEREGKVVAYYNLNEIIDELNVTSISITLNNDSQELSRVRLLEATSASKPAVSEERVVHPKN